MRDGRPVCLEWNRPFGCTSSLHDSHHLCTGCATELRTALSAITPYHPDAWETHLQAAGLTDKYHQSPYHFASVSTSISHASHIPKLPPTRTLLSNLQQNSTPSSTTRSRKAATSCLCTSWQSYHKSKKTFGPAIHVKRSNISQGKDRNDLPVTTFRIPVTKAAPAGEDIYWAAQDKADPKAALENHFLVNDPPLELHLFSWKSKNGLIPLTRFEFLKKLNAAAYSLGVESIKGHSIRIGSTLEYLLRNVPFDVVKSIGRWSSEAFRLYLREHALIMAPYLQNTPILEPFIRRIMPPLRA
jgi:hypothetical protein